VFDFVVRCAVSVEPGVGDRVPYAGQFVPEPAVERSGSWVVGSYADADLRMAAPSDQVFGRSDQRRADPAAALFGSDLQMIELDAARMR